MKRLLCMTGFCLLLPLQGAALAGESPRPSSSRFLNAFEDLKHLVGTWVGKGREGEGDVKFVYHLTGNGSTLIENYHGPKYPGPGASGMSTFYHMDGDDLRATHYCGIKNYPRFRAVSHDPSSGTVHFEFIDVSNLSRPGAYFTREITLTIVDHDHLRVAFNGESDGKAYPLTLELKRQSSEKE